MIAPLPDLAMHQPEKNRHAITALTFAVLGWTALPLFGALLGLYFASRARKEIDASHGDFTGHELAGAAATIAWIWLTLFLAALATGVVILTVLAVLSYRHG
jgi:uncharacterized membrane protein